MASTRMLLIKVLIIFIYCYFIVFNDGTVCISRHILKFGLSAVARILHVAVLAATESVRLRLARRERHAVRRIGEKQCLVVVRLTRDDDGRNYGDNREHDDHLDERKAARAWR